MTTISCSCPECKGSGRVRAWWAASGYRECRRCRGTGVVGISLEQLEREMAKVLGIRRQ